MIAVSEFYKSPPLGDSVVLFSVTPTLSLPVDQAPIEQRAL